MVAHDRIITGCDGHVRAFLVCVVHSKQYINGIQSEGVVVMAGLLYRAMAGDSQTEFSL